MLNEKYEVKFENEYDSFERLQQDIEYAEGEKDNIYCFMSFRKPISKCESIVTSLESVDGETFFNTYIGYDDMYTLWIDCPIDVSKYNSLEELCDDLKNHFEYNYIVGMNERELHCSDEDNYYEDDEV